MDLPIEKLEKFTLEDFINVYRFYLCKRTTSQNQIASYLQFDSDSIAIINHPPDNFSRCEKLYELIQKKSTVVKFLEALNETGNEHIIKFIKETDFSALGQLPSTSANPNPNQRRGLWFNIPEPIDSFCGREDFLTSLHDKLKPCDDSKTKANVLSQIKVVTGLGGIGKTETATKYTREQQNFYNNLIWINAENEYLMENMFLKLADEIQIPVKDSEGKPRQTQDIVRDIYNKICEGGKSNLIVFDNAEDYESCKNFFPLGLAPELKSMIVILVTSRNQEWISPIGEIEFLLLDKMAESESLEFILKKLDIKDSPELKGESKEFIHLLGGLPLALQQAVAYVKHQKKVKAKTGKSYEMSEYVKEFKAKAEKLQNYPHAPGSTTVFVTWRLTLEKIKEDELYGEIAIEIIEAMSFLYADKIPTGFLLELLPLPPPPQDGIKRRRISPPEDDDFESDLGEGLTLLEQFSMIKIPQNETTNPFASIHRQVQFVIIHGLKVCDRLIELFDHLGEKCQVVLEKTKVTELSDIFLNAYQMVNNQLDLAIPLTEKFLDFKGEYGGHLWKASRFTESLDLYIKVYKERAELLGESHEKTLSAHYHLALLLLKLGKYDESLNHLKQVLEKEQIHFGMDHLETMTTKCTMASVLIEQKKYTEALEMSQEVLAQRNKIHGENHPQTLKAQNSIALLHSKLGDLSKALTLYEELEEKQTQLLGPDHRDVLITKQNKATVLFKTDKFEEALKIFNEVYGKNKETLGEDHLSTIDTLGWIAQTLEQDGKFGEALKMYQKVHEIRKTNLGVNHPNTIHARHKIAGLLQEQGEYQESLEIYEQVLPQQIQIHGDNHPETLDSQNQIARLHLELGNLSKAFALYQVLEQKLTEILGPDSRDVLATKHNKACALYKMGRLEEATKLFNEVYKKKKDKLGENHLDTITTLFLIAGTLENQKKLTEALEMYKKVYRVRKTSLGERHPDTIEVENKMADVLLKQKKYGESLEIYQQVLAQQIKIHGENHPDTIKTQHQIALVHSNLGNFSKALTLFEELEKKQIEIRGPDHPDVLQTKHEKTIALRKLGCEEATKKFNDVYQTMKEILGENHLDTITTLKYIADLLELEEKFPEALEMYKKVYRVRKTILPERHPDTIEVEKKLVDICVLYMCNLWNSRNLACK